MVRIFDVLVKGCEVRLPENFIVEEDKHFLYVRRVGNKKVDRYLINEGMTGQRVLDALAKY